MDTGVEHGRRPDAGLGDTGDEQNVAEDDSAAEGATTTAGEASSSGSADPSGTSGRAGTASEHVTTGPVTGSIGMPFYDDAPTTILDLRIAFAEAGPQGAPPLGVVQVEREHPFRAGIAFVAVLAFIAFASGGLVMAVAAGGKAVMDKFNGPATCSTRQVSDGVALATWLTDVLSRANAGSEVTRTGCTIEGAADPQTGQSASSVVAAGKPTTSLLAILKSKDCTLSPPSSSGYRSCTVELGSRLAAVELRPAKNKKSTTVTLTFR